MGGRYEKEVKINSNVEEKLKRLPSVVSDYYYSLVSSGKSYITAQAYVYNIEKFLEAMVQMPQKLLAKNLNMIEINFHFK
jgi:hypothetical protein